MEDTIQQILTYVRAVWQRRWMVLVVTIVVCAIGWPFVMTMPDIYRVSAKIELDTQTILKPLLAGIAVDNQLTKQTALLLQNTVLTRPNLEKVAKAADLDHLAMTPQEFDAMVSRLRSKIQINRVRIRLPNPRQKVNDVYVVEYEDSDANIAKRVVEEMLTLFIEKTLGVARKDTKMTEKFLSEQIKGYEAKLIDAEAKLKDFKRKNVGMMPREGETFYMRLSGEETRLEESQLALDEATKRRDEIQNQIDKVLATTNSGEDTRSLEELSPLETRIQNMQTRLDELLLQYTDAHPDVTSTRRMLEGLKKQSSQGKVSGSESEEARLLESNPVYQDLKVQKSAQEADVAALTVRIKLYRDNVRKLKSQMDTMPAIEAELTNLNRDYSVLRRNYEELVKRRESAKLSFEAEAKGNDIYFKIIEPPRVPSSPIWPNRPLLETGVLFAGIVLGAVLAILLMMIRSTFSTSTSLKEKFGLPVFGVISTVVNAKEIAKNRVNLVLFGMASMVVFAVYGIIVASHVFKFSFLPM